MTKYVCVTCGYVYDEEKGAAPSVLSRTPFDKISESWTCPMCGAGKKYFIRRG